MDLSRRAAAGMAALAFAAGCSNAPAAAPPAGPTPLAVLDAGQVAGPVVAAGRWAFVPNMGDGTVTEFDAARHVAVATIRVADPRVLLDQGCAPSSVHAYYYGSWGLRECDTPFAVAWDGTSLWAVDDGLRRLVRVDPVARAVAGSLPLPAPAWALAISGRTAWLSGYWDDTVYALDLGDGRVLARVPVAHGPAAVAADAAGAWVLCARAGRLVRVTPGGVGVDAASEPWAVDVEAGPGGGAYVRGTNGGDLRLHKPDGSPAWSAPGPQSLGRVGIDHVGVVDRGAWLAGPTTALLAATDGATLATIPDASIAVTPVGGELWTTGIDGRVRVYANPS